MRDKATMSTSSIGSGFANLQQLHDFNAQPEAALECTAGWALSRLCRISAIGVDADPRHAAVQGFSDLD